MIVKKNLSEQIYESLRWNILDQKIHFGEKLVNRQLQEKYGVSSTPVRDAINRLYLDGLLDEISNGGARVISFDYRAALEVNDIVAMITREAVSMAMAKAPITQLASEMADCIAMQHKNENTKNYFAHDKKFHTAFFNYCENAHLAQLHNQYSALWELLVLFYYRDKESNRGKAISEHERILDAVRDGDVPGAMAAVDHHFQEAVKPLRKSLEVISLQDGE